MRALGLSGAIVVASVSLLPCGAAAQDVVAEVRTWSGQSYRLEQPTFEVYYTVLPRTREIPGTEALPESGVPGPGYGVSGLPGATPTTGTPVSLPGAGVPGGDMGAGLGYGDSGLRISGTLQGLGSLVGDRRGEPQQGRRQRQSLTFARGEVESQVPVARVATLTFSRQPLMSALPQWVGPQYRYGASATLLDGTQVDADYVNFGTTLLRGSAPQGRVDIPWEEIESIRFSR